MCHIEPIRIKAAYFLALFSLFFEVLPGQELAKAELGVTKDRFVNFSGYVWRVKCSEKRVGPGANYFSDNLTNVWVDVGGKLHLNISSDGGKWSCAEVISEQSFGFGTYRFYISTPLSKLDPNITLGLFTWSDVAAYSHREIDVECGKWGKVSDTNNAQFVVQPYQPIGHLLRYHVPENAEATYSFSWQSNNVQFRCVEGNVAGASTNAVIKEWIFSNNTIPQPGGENARINLWLSTGRAPLDTNDTEIVIAKFEFLPFAAR